MRDFVEDRMDDDDAKLDVYDDRGKLAVEWRHAFENIDPTEDLEHVKSLNDNCLNRITKNFERFFDAYLTSEDSDLRHNLELLQRAFSSQVIKGLSTEELLKDRYLDFVINRHLKELDLSIFIESGCSLKAIEKRIVQVGNGFTKVSFKFPFQVPEDSISQFLNATICHLSNVEVLHILKHCNDSTLKNISSFCTKLTELNIDGSSKVATKGLKMLCKKHREDQTECLIKILSLGDIKVSDSTITFLLDKMPHLEVLNYSYLPNILYSMHKEDLNNNTLNHVKKSNLTKLDFMYSTIISKAEVLQVWTEVCPNIKTVCINFCTKEDCLNLISRFENLENFRVTSLYTFVKHIEFNNFLRSNGIKLRNLHINGFVLSVPILIESCPKLQNLVLTDILFQSLEKNHTKGQPSNKISLHSLSHLCMVGITFSDQFTEDSVTNILLSSPNLRKLSFEICQFENSEMNIKLAKFCEDGTLKHLRFYSCDIDIALLESIILTCSSLLTLTIDSCDLIRSDESLILHQLRDTARSFVKIVYTKDYEINENSVIDEISLIHGCYGLNQLV